MELIYMYIDKYRTFENQKIQISDKFFVNYDEKLKILSIEKNMDYFDLYPNNIVNISGILGKNGTGKSSLLSLIGEKIEKRHAVHEIFDEEDENPHEKIDIFSFKESAGIKKIRYTSSYFLVYYTKIDGETTFIFETNNPKEYIGLFDNSDEWTRIVPGNDPRLNYYISKGWFAAAFKCKNKKNFLIDNIQNYPSKKNIEKESVIIYLNKSTSYMNKMHVAIMNDDESIIAIKRKNIPMESILFETQLKFLVKQMNLPSLRKQMYKDNKYEISIEFADFMPSLFTQNLGSKIDSDKIIEDYRDFKIAQLYDWQKIMLAFLNQYAIFLLKVEENINYYSKEKQIATDLCEKSTKYKPVGYLEIKELYYKKIEYILDLISNKFITLSEVKKCANALEHFLKNASVWGFKYNYKKGYKLIIEIFKNSNINAAKNFFENFIDEDMHKNLQQEDSVLGGFLEICILRLSDGEKENLSLFSSIDEQIALNSSSEKFIMLFDEIERAMHPELCRRLIFELIDFFKQYHDKEFQIIIASHSPFIASDLRKENVICLKREKNLSEVEVIHEKPFAQNIHTILKSQFFLDSFMGEYAMKCVKLLLECLKKKDNKEIIKHINRFLDCPNDKKISSIDEAKQFIQYIINSIGEPLISMEFEQRFYQKKWWQNEEKIKYLKQKILELEEK